jgi:hypothetical protein
MGKGNGAACYPLNRAARRAYDAAQSPPYVPHPLPEVLARDAQPHEVPLGAKRIAKIAEAAGWLTAVTYSRGTTMTARGATGKVADCLVLRAMRPADMAHAVASWLDGGFEFAYVGLRGELARKVGARDLRTFIETPPVDQRAAVAA